MVTWCVKHNVFGALLCPVLISLVVRVRWMAPRGLKELVVDFLGREWIFLASNQFELDFDRVMAMDCRHYNFRCIESDFPLHRRHRIRRWGHPLYFPW